MPKTPAGHKRPADVVSNAVRVMRIATGEVEESQTPKHGHAGGAKGGPSRARKLSPAKRSEIARIAAQTRWKKSS